MSRPGTPGGALLGSLILVAVAVLAGLPGLGDRDFWPQDEARYGTVSLEMWNGGHPAVPHLNGKIYQDKPPGYFWLVNLAATIRGQVDEWATRLPSLIGAALLALGAFWMLAPGGGWAAGLLAGLVTLASWFVIWESRQAHLDVLFGGLMAVAMASFTRALEPDRARYTFLGLFLIGCAILVKGPLALIPVVAFAVASLLLRRPKAFFNAALLPGLIVMLLPALFWIGWAYFHLNGVKDGSGLEYVRGLFLDQERRIQSGSAHVREGWLAVYYYFRELPLGLAPFFPIVLFAFSRGVRRSLETMRPAFVVAGTWLVLSFVIQSLFPGKRGLYMVPLAAPFGVLCAAAVWSSSRAALTFASGWGSFVACAIFIAGGIFVAVNVDDGLFADARAFVEKKIEGSLCQPDKESAETKAIVPNLALVDDACKARVAALDWTAMRRGALISGLAAVVLAAIALTSLALGALRTGLAWTAAAVAIAIGLALGFILPHFDPLISRRPAAEAARTAVDVGGRRAPLAFFGHLDEAFPFYVGRPVPELIGYEKADTTEERARDLAIGNDFLKQPGAVLIVRRSDLLNLWVREAESGPSGPLGRDRISGPLQAGKQNFFLLKAPR